MIVNILCCIVLCIIIIISAISYYNLNKNLQVSDITITKQVYYEQVKGMNLALLILSILGLMIQGYFFWANDEPKSMNKFQGNKEKCGVEKCSGTEGIKIGN